jgi:hypothetical protein
LVPAEQGADVVAGLALVEDLAEHLDPGAVVFCVSRRPDDLDLVAGVQDALLTLPVTTVPTDR